MIARVSRQVGRCCFVFCLALSLLCVPLGAQSLPRPLQVLATTSIIADLAQEIGGNRVAVVALMGPGIDPHAYKATAGDLKKLTSAELILFNGLFLESKLSDILSRLQDKAHAVAASIPAEQLIYADTNKQAPDPHVWFDPTLWQYAVLEVARVFSLHRSDDLDFFNANARAYIARMQRLDGDLVSIIARIPKKHRVLITSHDAFAYYGRRYGLEHRGVQGMNTLSEAGIQDIRALAEFVVQRRLPAIFVESSVSPKTIQALQEAVAGRGHRVKIGGKLYSDALGEPKSLGGSYLGMLRYNTTIIYRGLSTP